MGSAGMFDGSEFGPHDAERRQSLTQLIVGCSYSSVVPKFPSIGSFGAKKNL